MDLLVQPAHLVAAVAAVVAPSSEGKALSPPTAKVIIKEEVVPEQQLFDEDINVLENSKSSRGVPCSLETVAKLDGEKSSLGVETVLLKDNSAMVMDQQVINWTTVIDNLNETIKKVGCWNLHTQLFGKCWIAAGLCVGQLWLWFEFDLHC